MRLHHYIFIEILKYRSRMMVFLGNARSMAMSSAKMRVPSIKFRYGHNRLAGSQTPTHGATVAPQVFFR